MTPGDVASVLGKENAASIINNRINVDSLLSLVQDFVPTVRNSYTECVPCGGAVRAEAEASGSTQRGCAGGYVGMLDGGHIWGNDTRAWKDVSVGASYSRRSKCCGCASYPFGVRHRVCWRLCWPYEAV